MRNDGEVRVVARVYRTGHVPATRGEQEQGNNRNGAGEWWGSLHMSVFSPLLRSVIIPNSLGDPIN